MLKKTIIVKPVDRTSVQERDSQESYYKDSKTGNIISKTKMNKNKVVNSSGESATDGFKFRYNHDGTRLITGLSARIENPWYVDSNNDTAIKNQVSKLGKDYALSTLWDGKLERLIISKTITKQRYLEILASVNPDTYTDILPNKVNGLYFTKDKDLRTYLQKFEVIFYDKANIFTSNTPRGRMSMVLIDSRPEVFSASKEKANSKHSYYLAEEFEDAIESFKLNDLENKAIFIYQTIKNKYPLTGVLEDSIIYHIGSLCSYDDGKPVLKGQLPPVQIDRLLNDYIKNSGKYKESYIKKFMSISNLYKDNKELFYTRYLIRKAIDKGVIVFKNNTYYWLSQKGSQDRYKFTSLKNLETLVFNELNTYEDGDTENNYYMIREEVKAKKGILPTNI